MPAIAVADEIGAPGGSEVRTWGIGNTTFYGQTITVPSANVLTQFSFWLGRTSPASSTPTPSIDFRAYVYAWNTASSTVSGSALYMSSLMNHSATSGTPFTRYDFATGGLSLMPGGAYALFLEAAGGSGGVFWESTDSDGYAGGSFIFNNSSTVGGTWDVGFPTAADLRFNAQFVPEPGSLLLAAIGISGIAVARRRRKRIQAS